MCSDRKKSFGRDRRVEKIDGVKSRTFSASQKEVQRRKAVVVAMPAVQAVRFMAIKLRWRG